MIITEKIVDITTNEETIIEREATAEELAQWETDQAAEASRHLAEAAKASDKAALLAKLGITEDEAKLLLS
jgi:hypothetical protein